MAGTGLAVSKAARVLGLQRYRKGHVSDGKEGKVEFQALKTVTFENPLASEGPIGRSGTTKKFRNASDSSVRKLPAQPKLWNHDFRGKAAGERDRVLIAHIEEVYGDYLPEHANAMREYLKRKDPKLLATLKEFGFKNLPENLRMPSIRQKVAERIARAAAGGYDEMTSEEKKSVRTATQRRLSPKI
ncbi:hypothetical protein AB7828_30800 [Tardiphaga sp. 215_C5_N2_1]|uniref:hypothetical protein n=1 Tax=Tardiphaga sp. 215_C5_N2_1 TaxID=3240774 RepID=UPI003F886032